MSKKQKKVLVRIIVALVLLAGVILLDKLALLPQWAMIVLYLVPYFVIGYDILWKALKGIKNRQVFDENFLMAVATVGALCLQEFKEGVAVMLFYQIGELFQSVAVGKSRKNIAALMDIRPTIRWAANWNRLIRTMWKWARRLWWIPAKRCPLTV